jgi:serine-type D-Ala-D-Ala carboxypeptidase/endopeptidase (penicillin-binding protein 4)
MRGRLLIVAVAVALSLGVPALTPSAAGAADQAGPAATLTTPVFSLRRLAGPLSRTVATSRLTAQLDKAVQGGAPGTTCLAVQDPAGRSLYARQPDLALIPASTLKLVTTAVALAKIGPDTRLVTDVRASSPAAGSGGSVGDLWLVGGGDPLLSTADFALEGGYLGQPRLATPVESLADKVVAAGVSHVTRVVGDDSRYDAQRTVPTWLPRYLTNFEISPLSALTVNKGFLTFKPPTAVTPSQATHAAAVLSDLLKARGVAVDAEPAAGVAPAGATTITSIESPPLAEVVGETLQHSDNLAAEMLLKELGVRFGGAGSTAAGLDVVERHLAETGLPADEVTAADGSGLDRSDRVTCDLLQQLLVTSGEDGALDRALPVAGGVGTLHRRFLNTPAAGKVRAKTGSLEGVVGLSGWASTQDGSDVAFSLLANGLPSTAAGSVLQDRVAAAVASWPQAPPPSDLAPLAAAPAAAAMAATTTAPPPASPSPP